MTNTVVAKLEFKLNVKPYIDNLEKIVEERLDAVAEDGKTRIQRNMRTSNRRGLQPSMPGENPRRGNSELANNLHWKRDGKMSRLIISSMEYSRILELGGTITGNSMPIPISDKAKTHRSQGGTTRTFPGKLVPIRSLVGDLLLIQKKNAGKNHGRNWTIHYVLKSKVTIQARPFLRPLLSDERFQKRLINIMGAK